MSTTFAKMCKKFEGSFFNIDIITPLSLCQPCLVKFSWKLRTNLELANLVSSRSFLDFDIFPSMLKQLKITLQVLDYGVHGSGTFHSFPANVYKVDMGCFTQHCHSEMKPCAPRFLISFSPRMMIVFTRSVVKRSGRKNQPLSDTFRPISCSNKMVTEKIEYCPLKKRTLKSIKLKEDKKSSVYICLQI